MEYQIIRSSRKTLALQITPDGKLLVRCPNRMSGKEIQAFVQSKYSWIQKHMPKEESEKLPPFTSAEIQSLSQQALQDIPVRVRHFAAEAGIRYGKITIRNQKTRWGSCSSQGTLNFNCLLMLTPPEVRDYVVVHELCHRQEMNHSAAFWAAVEQIMPDYKKHKKWLKDHGGTLIARLP